MNAAHDLYALIITIACGSPFDNAATAAFTSVELRSTVAVAAIGMLRALAARSTPSRPALPYASFW